MNNRPAIVRVQWVDSTSLHGWSDRKEVEDNPLTCETVGFLVEQGVISKTICLSVADNKDGSLLYGETIIIPNVSITSFTELAADSRGKKYEARH